MNELIQTKTIIENFLKSAEKYKGSYCWKTTGLNASARRSREFTNEFNFVFQNETYCITEDLRVSCKNFYYSRKIFVNGEEKTIRAVKTALTKIEKLLGA